MAHNLYELVWRGANRFALPNTTAIVRLLRRAEPSQKMGCWRRDLAALSRTIFCSLGTEPSTIRHLLRKLKIFIEKWHHKT